MEMTKGISEDSIAVLPFRNLSSDKENEYFSDGVTEEIINALTKVEGLNVIARSSAFTFKGQGADPREVGKRLSVAYILEGSVRKSGNQVRVSAQLIESKDGFHVFSEVYDEELKDIFQVQDQISNKIAQKFTENVGRGPKSQKLVSSSTENMEAYELYLKGRHRLSKASLEDAQSAIQFFEAAIQKDQDFVLPVAGLAACYTFLGGSGMMEADRAFQIAKDHANRAIRIDDRLAESHLALAKSYFWCEWDFELTGRALRDAIRLAPGTSDIHGFNSTYLMAIGKLEEALIEAQLAAKLDPLSLSSQFHLGELYYRSERYIEAVEIFDAILAQNPFHKQVNLFKAWSHLLLGELDSAIEIFKGIPITPDETSTFYGGLAFAYYKQMQYDKVLECMRNFRQELEQGNMHWLNYNYALIFRALGEPEKMFTYLKKGLEEKITPLLFIQVDPVWKEFRNNPDFEELMERSFVQDRKDKIVILKSDTREELELNLNELLFVEAQENYSRIVWQEKEELKERLLRVSLKNIEGQISDNRILRCHRSYIINARVRFRILGNTNGYHLHSDLFPDNIPVSRSLGKSVVAVLKEHGSKF